MPEKSSFNSAADFEEPRIEGVAGVILAGGHSSRFGGNKALAPFAGLPLIEHLARLFRRLFTERLLVTNAPEDYRFLDWPTTGDSYRQCGPLAGIEAALRRIDSPRAFVVGCDMPLVDPLLIRLLCGLPATDDAVVPWLAAGPEPLCALYHRRALPAIDAALQGGEHRIWLALAGLKVRRVDESEILQVLPDLSSFCNINHRQDLEALLRLRCPKNPASRRAGGLPHPF